MNDQYAVRALQTTISFERRVIETKMCRQPVEGETYLSLRDPIVPPIYGKQSPSGIEQTQGDEGTSDPSLSKGCPVSVVGVLLKYLVRASPLPDRRRMERRFGEASRHRKLRLVGQ